MGAALAAAALALAGVAVAVLVARDGDDGAPRDAAARAGGTTPVRVEAPTVEFERFDGGVATLGDYRGRPVVVNFWASWCPPCVAEMPDFELVHQRLGDQVAFLGVNLTDHPADADRLARRTGVTYELARDPEGQLFTAFGGFSMPSTFFVSSDGRVVADRGGSLAAQELEATIRRELLG